MPYDPRDYDAPSVKLERFLQAARDQIGDQYRYGAEASDDDANPTAFDSSELVEWAAHQAGFHGMPDGSWNQYRYLHDAGATVSVEEALHTKGALVFGFSSDPLESSDRPARAYVGISLGNGKILDVSERAGEVREMDPGSFYSYGAKIPEFHAVDDTLPPDTPWPDRDTVDQPDDPRRIPGGVGPMPDQPPAPARSVSPDGHIIHEDLPAPAPAPARSVSPDGHIIHEDLPAPAPYPDGPVCYPDEPPPEEQVCYPDDDNIGPTSQSEAPAGASGYGTPTYDTPGYDGASGYGDAPAYAADPGYAADASGYAADPGYAAVGGDSGAVTADASGYAADASGYAAGPGYAAYSGDSGSVSADASGYAADPGYSTYSDSYRDSVDV